MKFFWKFLRALSADHHQHWRRDPLAHPELERMTLTELADLPLGRVWVSRS